MTEARYNDTAVSFLIDMDGENTMNLLIVGDEIDSICAVSEMLDWKALGVAQRFTARNAREAKDCIRRNRVDILLCDIEMPQESGFDLLEWVKGEGLEISCIYMTRRADFSYAKRAMQLGSRACLLKPIDPSELEQALTAELKKCKERERLRALRQDPAENWEHSCHQFWRDLYYGELPANRDTIRRQIETLRLDLNADWLYCPTLVVVRNWGQDLEDDHRLNRYGVHNVVVELFEREAERCGFWWTVFPFGQHGQMTICGGANPRQLAGCSRRFAETYLAMEERYLSVRSVCYLGKRVAIEQMPEEMEWLMRMDNTRLQNTGIAVHNDETELLPFKSDLGSRFERWSLLLDGGFFEKAQSEILHYLTDQEGNRWFNKRRFRYFLSRYAGMLTIYAQRRQIPLYQLTADPDAAKCFETSDRGLDHMRRWVKCSLGQLNQMNENRDPVTETKNYIALHLSEALELPRLAEHVHLNQDYLTRIFKRETGTSVKSYIVGQRMEKARELLETSKTPIADIACQIGYYNYTSFNRIFKKYYGVSPQSYRRKTE